MMPVANSDDSASGQSAKRPTDCGKRDTDIFTNVRAVHWQMDFNRGLAFGDLQMFEQLQEHRQLGHGASLAQQKRMALGLPQFLA